jgi:hypothetical protein
MTRTTTLMAAGLALTVTLPAVSAQAAGTLTRTFVSSTGVDSNPCTTAQPCASFAAAYTAVQANGIVAALDPGKYGPLTINMPVTIDGNGWAAITAPAGGSGITINTGSDNVTIQGVSIDAVAAGTNGIAISASSTVTITLSGLIIQGAGVGARGIYLNSSAGQNLNIIDTTVKDFTSSGIAILPVGGQTNVLISNSYSLNNGQDGIKIAATGGGGGAQVTYAIDRTTVSGNSVNGFDFEATGGNAVVGALSQSVASLNNNFGINVNATGAGIFNSRLIENSGYGLSVTNGGLVTVSSSSFINYNLDVTTDSNNGSTVTSFGNNAYSFYSGNIVQQSLH